MALSPSLVGFHLDLENRADSHFSRDHRYVTLKVHINALTPNRELQVYQYLKCVKSDHRGGEMIRMLEDSFKLQGPHGTQEVLSRLLLA